MPTEAAQGYAPASAAVFQVRTNRNSDFAVMLRIRSIDGGYSVQADFSAIAWSIYNLDSATPTTPLNNSGSGNEALTVSAVVLDSLTAGDLWTVDGDGYNFKHVPDRTEATIAARHRITYKFTETGGEIWYVSGTVQVEDIITT